ncbi:CG12857 [Drosophila busckii]|uniref:CG12857 n=1 Tax=Drosophila busckii TaxID=30019 RepID=A0A0M4ESG7_DROBS|nr:actin-binding protein IPP [Drosophila busckii]ALC45567.1 CG12857 [Drosophila busckii]
MSSNVVDEALDAATLAKINECCSKPQQACATLKQRSLKQMGLDDKTQHECQLMCSAASLRSTICNILQSGLNSDIKLRVEGETFDCHLDVLRLASDYFRELEPTNYVEFSAEQLTARGFAMVYLWLTSPALQIDADNILEIFVAAQFLRMKELLEQLWWYFVHDYYWEGQAFKLYIQAVDRAHTEALQALLITRINRFFLKAVATLQFLSLKCEHVVPLLQSNLICVNSEVEVFMSARRWLQYDWQQRQQHIPRIMETVRFDLMPAWYIVSLKAKQRQLQLQQLLDHPFMRTKIDGALSQSVTQLTMNKQKQLETQSAERMWIIDEKAAHHHLYKCANWCYLDASLFNRYLQQIIAAGPAHCKSLRAYEPANLMPCCRTVAKGEQFLNKQHID